jgi:hypothetical protein
MSSVDSVRKFTTILMLLTGLALNSSALSGAVAVAKIAQTEDTQSQTSEKAKH